MAHTKDEAQNFASRASFPAPLIRELYTLLGEIEFADQFSTRRDQIDRRH